MGGRVIDENRNKTQLEFTCLVMVVNIIITDVVYSHIAVWLAKVPYLLACEVLCVVVLWSVSTLLMVREFITRSIDAHSWWYFAISSVLWLVAEVYSAFGNIHIAFSIVFCVNFILIWVMPRVTVMKWS